MAKLAALPNVSPTPTPTPSRALFLPIPLTLTRTRTLTLTQVWWATAVSPLFTMHVLLNLPATGVAQANGKNLKRYYDSWPDEYAQGWG